MTPNFMLVPILQEKTRPDAFNLPLSEEATILEMYIIKDVLVLHYFYIEHILLSPNSKAYMNDTVSDYGYNWVKKMVNFIVSSYNDLKYDFFLLLVTTFLFFFSWKDRFCENWHFFVYFSTVQ